MLRRVSQLQNLGRFTRFEHREDDQLRFQRLTLLFALNASGKSTLARVLAAAGAGDVDGLLLDQTLDTTVPPQVTLRFDHGICRFDGARWTTPRPEVRVFDRDFVEANVYVGRRASKPQRKAMLDIALGVEHVGFKMKLDGLTPLGRKLAFERKEYQAAIATAAVAAQLSEAEFLGLSAIDDEPAERARLLSAAQDAVAAAEIVKRARPDRLPDLPVVDFDGIERLLAHGALRIGDEAEGRVRAHLDGRLAGRGQAWVREGIEHDDGSSCPYCGQDVAGVALVSMYRTFFDRGWDALKSSVDDAIRQLDLLDTWWGDVRHAGSSNVRALDAWADLDGLERPSLDSARRKEEIDRLKVSLLELLRSKLARLDAPMDDAAAILATARIIWDELSAAIRLYNTVVDRALASIRVRCDALAGLSVERSRRELRLLDARVQRHSLAIQHAIAERARLDAEKEDVERTKATIAADLKALSASRLGVFGDRVNRFLESLCAAFRLEELDTERVGGTGARFTLVIADDPSRRLAVKDKRGEERFARVLSDGDRSTLALAVFLTSLEDLAGLDRHVIVFDDPMTSLDWARCEATAEQITSLATRCRQVLVLSHNAPFLAEVAYDWNRFGGRSAADLAEIVLDRGSCSLHRWNAEEHVSHEHLRRWRALSEFVGDPALDGKAAEIAGEIRKYLEGHVRMRWPDLARPGRDTLEAIINRLKSEPALRSTLPGLSDKDIGDLERLCAFGAKHGNHASGHREVASSDPAAVRKMARSALQFGR